MPRNRVKAIPLRLQQARHRAELTQEQAAERSGLSRTSVARYETGTAPPSSVALYALASLYGVTTGWLTGEEEMTPALSRYPDEDWTVQIAPEAPNSATRESDQQISGQDLEMRRFRQEIGARMDSLETAIRTTAVRTTEPALGVRHVEIYEVDAAAGAGMHIEDAPIRGTLAFRREWLTSNAIDPNQCSVIGVTGESMEPTLADGCSILVDGSEFRRRRRAGRIFVIDTADGLIVKRAGRNDTGEWRIDSDHPAWDSEPWPENANVVGEVRWMARTL